MVSHIEERVVRKLFLGFIQIHILHHTKTKPIYGMWMLEELREHGYTMSEGTLYSVLQPMEKEGLLAREDKLMKGSNRNYYTITLLGAEVLDEAGNKANELFKEIKKMKRRNNG